MMAPMDFDDLLVNHIGELGLYQKTLLPLLSIVTAIVTSHNLIQTFTAVNPGYVCVKEITSATWEDVTMDTTSAMSSSNETLLLSESVNGYYSEDYTTGDMYLTSTNFYLEDDVIHLSAACTNAPLNRSTEPAHIFSDWVSEFDSNGTKGGNSSYSKQKGRCLLYGFKQDVYKSTIASEWFLVCTKEWLTAFSQSVYMVGCLLGSVVCGYLTDLYGRKKILVLLSLGNFVFGTVSALANNLWVYTVSRFLLGVVAAGVFNAAYVLALELVGPSYRQLAATTMMLASSCGVMLLALSAYCIRHWRLLQLALSLPALVCCLVYIWIAPESPRWLMSKNKFKEADDVIKKMTRVNHTHAPSLYQNTAKHRTDSENGMYTVKQQKVEDSGHMIGQDQSHMTLTDKENHNNHVIVDGADIDKHQISLEKDLMIQDHVILITKSSYGILDICRTTHIRSNAICITILWLICATVYYGLSLYSSSLGGNDFLNMFLSGVVEVPAYLSCSFLCKRFGYKKPLAASMFLCGIVLICNMLAADVVVANIILSLVGKFGVSITFGCIYAFAAELFPTVIRTLSIGVTSTGARAGAFVAPYINLLGSFERVAPLVVFGIMGLVGVFVVWLLPETKGRPLPDTIEDAERLTKKLCCQKQKTVDDEREKYKFEKIINVDAKS